MGASRVQYQPISDRITAFRNLYPESIALTYGDQVLTYEQLDLRAEQFAAYLLHCGVTPGSAVAICLSRSFDWIIAALSIMRVGAAYVPLDPAWPDSRLIFSLQDSNAKALVAPAELLERLKSGAHGIDPVRDAGAISMASQLEPVPNLLDSVAYVIYTSGSTGAPKGVEITHANLSHLIEWHVDAFRVTRDDRVSHLAGLGFDAAVWEVWPTLSAGATLCLAEDAVRSSPALMQQWMLRERVSIGYVPTVHAEPLMALQWPAGTTLRYLLTGGDVLHQAPSASLPFAVVNNYGPTECTVVSTSVVLAPGTPGTPTIGRPIAGSTVYLLDEDGKEVSDGQLGEIYIGGHGVGRGYRNLPEASGNSFLPDPFSGEPHARMYRSGDLGVRRTDGQIAFHGRKDRQVKIRGQRIELDEIGSVLNRHPSVAFAVATSKTVAQGELQLVAYVLPKEQGHSFEVADFRKYLLRCLPTYMVPALYIKLDALPLSPSGKVDLDSLPSLSVEPLFKGTGLTPHGSQIETRLLNLVQDLLQNGDIHEDNDFFLAGGHSLLGMQLVMHLSEDFDIEVSLHELFEASTIKELALLVESKLAEVRLLNIWKELLPLRTVLPNSTVYELGGDAALVSRLEARITEEFGRSLMLDELTHCSTFRQQAQLLQRELKKTAAPKLSENGNSFFWVQSRNDNLARAMSHDQTVLFVGLTHENLEELGKTPSLESMAACLVQKILAIQPRGPFTLGGLCIGGLLAFEVACQMESMGQEVSLLTLLDTPSPTYYGVPHLLGPRLRQPHYLIRRVNQLGIKSSLGKVWDRVLEKMPDRIVRRHTRSRLQRVFSLSPVQTAINLAACRYNPKKYLGKVLLLLAADHAPHFNFQKGWQPLTGEMLMVQYIDAHHSELAQSPAVNHVAAVINAHLRAEEVSLGHRPSTHLQEICA